MKIIEYKEDYSPMSHLLDDINKSFERLKELYGLKLRIHHITSCLRNVGQPLSILVEIAVGKFSTEVCTSYMI